MRFVVWFLCSSLSLSKRLLFCFFFVICRIGFRNWFLKSNQFAHAHPFGAAIAVWGGGPKHTRQQGHAEGHDARRAENAAWFAVRSAAARVNCTGDGGRMCWGRSAQRCDIALKEACESAPQRAVVLERVCSRWQVVMLNPTSSKPVH